MTNFEKQLNEAVKTYASIDGRSEKEVAKECLNMESQTAKNVMMLMFAAR